MYNNKQLRDVAKAVTKVMEGQVNEELKGNQHKIDANNNNKVDAHDFKLLRAGKKVAKEEVQQVDEAKMKIPDAHVKAMKDAYGSGRVHVKNGMIHHTGEGVHGKETNSHSYDGNKIGKHVSTISVEEQVEQIDEIKLADLPKRTIKGKSYGADYEDPEGKDDADDKPAQPEKRGRGRPKGTFKRRYNTKVYKEQFSHLIDSYKTGGLKSIMEDMQIVEDADDIEEMAIASVKNKQGKKVEWNSIGGNHMVHVDGKPAHSGFLDHKSAAKLYNSVKEEVDNETFTKEVEAQKEKDSGKNKKADIAAASVQSVKNEEVEQVEERTLTEPEMDKREKVVKSMKKNLAGFKERYGNRGKEVLYSTATKIAKGEK